MLIYQLGQTGRVQLGAGQRFAGIGQACQLRQTAQQRPARLPAADGYRGSERQGRDKNQNEDDGQPF